MQVRFGPTFPAVLTCAGLFLASTPSMAAVGGGEEIEQAELERMTEEIGRALAIPP